MCLTVVNTEDMSRKEIQTYSSVTSFTLLRTIPDSNSSPNDVLDWSKFRRQILATKIMELVLKGKENIVGKGENAGYQHFLLFPNVFSRLLSQGPKNEGLSDNGLLTTL